MEEKIGVEYAAYPQIEPINIFAYSLLLERIIIEAELTMLVIR